MFGTFSSSILMMECIQAEDFRRNESTWKRKQLVEFSWLCICFPNISQYFNDFGSIWKKSSALIKYLLHHSFSSSVLMTNFMKNSKLTKKKSKFLCVINDFRGKKRNLNCLNRIDAVMSIKMTISLWDKWRWVLENDVTGSKWYCLQVIYALFWM